MPYTGVSSLYLEKGFHTLSLQLDASWQAPIYEKLTELIKKINKIIKKLY